jgi:hypothetical protein
VCCRPDGNIDDQLDQQFLLLTVKIERLPRRPTWQVAWSSRLIDAPLAQRRRRHDYFSGWHHPSSAGGTGTKTTTRNTDCSLVKEELWTLFFHELNTFLSPNNPTHYFIFPVTVNLS